MQRAVREREAAIQQLAFHDELTGLPNRNQLPRSSSAGRSQRASASHGQLAVALVDLDRFKDINDTLGHHVGDDLLLEVGDRLRRGRGAPRTLVARLGGDEFAVLLPARRASPRPHAASPKLRRARSAAPIEIEDAARRRRARSIGIAIYPRPRRRRRRRCCAAPRSRCTPPRSGTCGSAFYDRGQDRHSVERLSLPGDLRRARSSRASSSCSTSPSSTLATGRVSGVEALLRWHHPRLGAGAARRVHPDRRADRARSAQLTALGAATRRSRRRRLAAPRARRSPSRSTCRRATCSTAELPRAPARSCSPRPASPAERLVLEITESSVMADPRDARGALLDEVTAMGVRHLDRRLRHRLLVARAAQAAAGAGAEGRPSFVPSMTRSDGRRGRSCARRSSSATTSACAWSPRASSPTPTLAALREMGCDLAQGLPRRPRRWPPPSCARLAARAHAARSASRVEVAVRPAALRRLPVPARAAGLALASPCGARRRIFSAPLRGPAARRVGAWRSPALVDLRALRLDGRALLARRRPRQAALRRTATSRCVSAPRSSIRAPACLPRSRRASPWRPTTASARRSMSPKPTSARAGAALGAALRGPASAPSTRRSRSRKSGPPGLLPTR